MSFFHVGPEHIQEDTWHLLVSSFFSIWDAPQSVILDCDLHLQQLVHAVVSWTDSLHESLLPCPAVPGLYVQQRVPCTRVKLVSTAFPIVSKPLPLPSVCSYIPQGTVPQIVICKPYPWARCHLNVTPTVTLGVI